MKQPTAAYRARVKQFTDSDSLSMADKRFSSDGALQLKLIDDAPTEAESEM